MVRHRHGSSFFVPLFLLAFALPYYALLCSTFVRFDRNLLPLLPFLALFAATVADAVAGERRKLTVVTPRKANRMAADTLMRRSDKLRTAFERVGNTPNGRNLDPRHVGERDHPRFGERRRPNRPG